MHGVRRSVDVRLIHTYDDSIELHYAERLLFRYVYVPRTAQRESPKPYFHPLCTLAGNEVTLFRPHDHVWHTGLAMTSAHVSGHNFWGGPTYIRDRGYVQLDNNGQIRHDGWDEIRCDNDGAVLTERLHWISIAGDLLIAEQRSIAVTEIRPDAGYWALDLTFRLENVTAETLVFGSPTTNGRPMAGYGGLFWRGPRSFLHGEIVAGGGLEGPEVMGKAAPWLAYAGRHDGNDQQSTLLFADDPGNPRFPNKWFVRNDPYACVSCSFMFDEEYPLPPAGALALNYRVVLADGVWSRERIEEYFRTTSR